MVNLNLKVYNKMERIYILIFKAEEGKYIKL